MSKLMTLDELWEELKKDPECKATIEEADKAYKLLKKMENLIIHDLEAKLAESEEKIKELEEKIVFEKSNAFELGERAIMSILKENKQLKQQLAEKNQILDWQNEIVEGVKQEEELLAQKLKSLGVDCIEDLGKEHNQYKISFCVEQLKKVKEFCIKINNKNQKLGVQKEPNLENLATIIDNQIKQLKEGK